MLLWVWAPDFLNKKPFKYFLHRPCCSLHPWQEANWPTFLIFLHKNDSKSCLLFQGSSDQCPVHCHEPRSSRHTDHSCDQMTGDQMNRPSRSRHTDDQSVVEQLLRQELSNFNETVSHFGWELIRNYSVIKENLKLIVHHFLWMSGYWKIWSKYLHSN